MDVATLTAVRQVHVAVGDGTAQRLLPSGQVQLLDGTFACVSLRGGQAFIGEVKLAATSSRASITRVSREDTTSIRIG